MPFFRILGFIRSFLTRKIRRINLLSNKGTKMFPSQEFMFQLWQNKQNKCNSIKKKQISLRLNREMNALGKKCCRGNTATEFKMLQFCEEKPPSGVVRKAVLFAAAARAWHSGPKCDFSGYLLPHNFGQTWLSKQPKGDEILV